MNYNGVVKGESVTIKGIEGRQIDLDIKLSGDDFESFAIDFGVSDSTYTRFLYNKKQGTLEVDRTYSGLTSDLNCQRKMFVGSSDELELHFVLDKFSIELFVNDWEKTMTTEIQTPLASNGIRFNSFGEAKVTIEKHHIVIA